MAPNLKLQTAIYGAREISHVTPRQLPCRHRHSLVERSHSRDILHNQSQDLILSYRRARHHYERRFVEIFGFKMDL